MPEIRKVVVACMDSRVVPELALGFGPGQAQVLRVNGGRITDEVLTGVAASAALFDIHEVVILHHTDCAMGKWDTEALRGSIERASGAACDMDFPTFTDADAALADDVEAVIRSPHLPDDLVVSGYRYDVDSAEVVAVVAPIRRGLPADADASTDSSPLR